MKFIAAVFLIALLSLVACFYLPWWCIAVTAFATGALIPQKPFLSFLAGFISLFALWGALAFFISLNNDHILAHRMSLLLFKTDNPLLLVLATALIGALVAGLAALTGSFLRPVDAASSS